MRIKYLILVISFIIIALSFSCDRNSTPPTGEDTVVIIDTTENDTTMKKIMLLEYTGVSCINCPKASKEMHDLIEGYKGSVVGIAFHPLGDVNAKPFSDSTIIWNELGRVLHAASGAPGLPGGHVDVMPNKDNKVLTYTEWESKIIGAFGQEADLKLDINSAYDESTFEITVDIDIEYFREAGENDYLALYVVEDHYIAKQKDTKSTLENYEHNNIARAAFGDNYWGVGIYNDITDMKYQKTFTYTVPQDNYWNEENLRIVAIVYDYEGTYSVKQIEEDYLFEKE